MLAKRTPSRRRWYRTREACIPPRSVELQQLQLRVETIMLTENEVSDRGEEETDSSDLKAVMRTDSLSKKGTYDGVDRNVIGRSPYLLRLERRAGPDPMKRKHNEDRFYRPLTSASHSPTQGTPR